MGSFKDEIQPGDEVLGKSKQPVLRVFGLLSAATPLPDLLTSLCTCRVPWLKGPSISDEEESESAILELEPRV